MKDQDQSPRRRSRRDRLPEPGEIAAWFKTYRTCHEQQKGGVDVEIVTHFVAKSLRKRLIRKPAPLPGAIGTWAVDATAKELHVRLRRSDAQFEEQVISLRRQVLSAFDKANKAVEPLNKLALARKRLRESGPHLDDLIALLNRTSTAHALNALPNALSYFGGNPKRWTDVLSALGQLPELRRTVTPVVERNQRRGSKGTPFEDAFITGLAEIWQKLTGTRPPKVVKDAKTRRSIGHLFYPFVERAFSDIQQSNDGLKKRIRRVLSSH